MKSKISVTVDAKILEMIEAKIRSGKFRNRSHVIEYGVKKLIEDDNEGASDFTLQSNKLNKNEKSGEGK